MNKSLIEEIIKKQGYYVQSIMIPEVQRYAVFKDEKTGEEYKEFISHIGIVIEIDGEDIYQDIKHFEIIEGYSQPIELSKNLIKIEDKNGNIYFENQSGI